jgi:phosphoribosylglycinamide formyltransferase-1
MLNIHPSLLPKYRGLHTHARALEAGETEAGCTVHEVTAELDGGPILGQARVPVEAGDTPDSLAARVLEQEHRLYPLVLRRFAEGDRSRIEI